MKFNRQYIQLILVAFLFILSTASAMPFNYINETTLVATGLQAVFLAAYLVLYSLGKENRLKTHLNSVFALFMVFFFATFLSRLSLAVVQGMISNIMAFGSYFVLFFPLLFLGFNIVFLARSKKYSKFAIIGIAIFIAIILVYYATGLIFKQFRADDEVFITYFSAKEFLSGMNPYNVSVSSLLYSNFSKVGASLTTNNTLVGVLDYPSLFFLTFIPFYLLNPDLASLSFFGLEVQAGVFVSILIFAVIFSLEKKYVGKPIYALLLFLAVAIYSIASITTYLMLAILVLAYSKLESRYSWLLIGLAVSVQEQLWLPALLLITYSFNNYGIKKGAKDLFGTAFVFIATNIFFIAQDPGAYIKAVLLPINTYLFPNGVSVFGYLIAEHYPVLLNAYTSLFILSSIVVVLFMLYTNEKKLIGILSIVPFFFLSHSLGVYYSFFLSFFIITLFVKDDKKNDVLSKSPKLKRLIPIAIFFILAAGIVVVYNSHMQYIKEFDIGISGQSLVQSVKTNSTLYTMDLNYNLSANKSIYIAVVGYYNLNEGIFGLVNTTILPNPQSCAGKNYTCFVNLNRIDLNSNEHSYQIKANLKWQSLNLSDYVTKAKSQVNKTRTVFEPVYAARAILYNGRDFYLSPSIYNFTSYNLTSKNITPAR